MTPRHPVSEVVALGRVIDLADDTAVVRAADGAILTRPSGSAPLALGDLVRIAPDSVTRVAQNTSANPPDVQDWWRLLEIAPNLQARATIRRGIRRYFDDRGFLELDPPTLAACPSLEVHLASIAAQVGSDTRYLQTSPEYHLKRALSAGLPRVYSLGRAYRDDESGAHHHAEFTMLEWYRTFEPIDALMSDVEALVALATGSERAWTRLTVAEALERYSTPTDQPDLVVERLVVDVEPRLAEMGAVFLTEYPSALASLAALHPDRPEVSLRFEAYVDGVELANGFGELTCAVEQRTRFESDQRQRAALGLPVPPIDERFLDALAAGLPPMSGIALGFDRLVMLATGATHLDDVTLFPPAIA